MGGIFRRLALAGGAGHHCFAARYGLAAWHLFAARHARWDRLGVDAWYPGRHRLGPDVRSRFGSQIGSLFDPWFGPWFASWLASWLRPWFESRLGPRVGAKAEWFRPETCQGIAAPFRHGRRGAAQIVGESGPHRARRRLRHL